VTVPNGGQTWQRGLSYFIQWADNVDEDVVVELYDGDALVDVLATAPSNGAYNWQVPLNVQPGENYSIKIHSATDVTLTDSSDAVFAIQ
jgi:hypothetical protein